MELCRIRKIRILGNAGRPAGGDAAARANGVVWRPSACLAVLWRVSFASVSNVTPGWDSQLRNWSRLGVLIASESDGR